MNFMFKNVLSSDNLLHCYCLLVYMFICPTSTCTLTLMISEVKNKSIILSNARKVRHYNDSLSVKIVVNAFIIIQWGSGVLNVTEIKMNSNTLNLNQIDHMYKYITN